MRKLKKGERVLCYNNKCNNEDFKYHSILTVGKLYVITDVDDTGFSLANDLRIHCHYNYVSFGIGINGDEFFKTVEEYRCEIINEILSDDKM